MRRAVPFSLLIALVISCAVPTGAVFALSDPSEGVTPLKIESVNTADETTETPIPLTGPTGGEVRDDTATDERKISEETPLALQDPIIEEESPAPIQQVVAPPPVMLPASPLLVTAYKASGAHLHAVQLYNNSSAMVSTGTVGLLYVAGGEEYQISLMNGWIEPRSYMIVAWHGESEYADSTFRFEQVGVGTLESIELHHEGYQLTTALVPTGYGGELLHRYKSAAGNYTTNISFSPGAATITGGGLYMLPDTPDLSVLEVLVNPKSCTYDNERADCYDFIKLRNDGALPIDLSLYRLRSGFSNTASTSSNTAYFGDVLLPGEVRTLTHDQGGDRVSFTANDGTVWLEDRYGYESYNLHVSPYIDSGLTAQAGKSWAYNNDKDQWQWATPSPHKTENNFMIVEPGKGAATESNSMAPCRDNQYRSEETNRCRNIATSNTLQPCREGQYRSEETNRCRSITATVAGILKPCADDQFRNPLTNRCKKIATADDIALADCGEGRERNPSTNRCRNVLSASTMTDTLPFPVQKTEQTQEDFVAWWTLGVVVASGLGYGVWEWRYELQGMGRRIVKFISGPQ